jgi:hypothetical protein
MARQRKRTGMPSAAELAQAVREERMDFDDALLDYLQEQHPERLDLSFFMVVKVVIGWASMGQWDKDIALSDTEELTVREIIDSFGLKPFVEAGAEAP